MTTINVHRRWTGKKVSLTISGWILALVFALPYIHMLITALKPLDEVLTIPTTYTPTTWAWDNFTGVWKEIPLATFIKSSLVISLVATIIVIVIAIPAAYYSARNNFRGRSLFLLLVLTTQMFSPTSLVVGIFREIVKFNLVDTYLSLILIHVAPVILQDHPVIRHSHNVVRADRNLASPSRSVHHIGRDGIAGGVPAQLLQNLLPLAYRRAKMSRTGDQVTLVKIVRPNPAQE